MAMFNKKSELEQKSGGDIGSLLPHAQSATTHGKKGYGIAEAIQLMRSLPVDQHPDLVVRVVRATLGSLDVRLPDIIEDASRKQKATQDKIAAEHAQVADLEKQLDARRKEIAALEADLKETTNVKERLQQAEKSAGPPPPPGPAGSAGANTLHMHGSGSGPTTETKN
jgi:phage shock protein A